VGRHATNGVWLGAPFFVAAALSVVALGLAAWATQHAEAAGTERQPGGA